MKKLNHNAIHSNKF